MNARQLDKVHSVAKQMAKIRHQLGVDGGVAVMEIERPPGMKKYVFERRRDRLIRLEANFWQLFADGGLVPPLSTEWRFGKMKRMSKRQYEEAGPYKLGREPERELRGENRKTYNRIKRYLRDKKKCTFLELCILAEPHRVKNSDKPHRYQVILRFMRMGLIVPVRAS